jgi:hypothetical protein
VGLRRGEEMERGRERFGGKWFWGPKKWLHRRRRIALVSNGRRNWKKDGERTLAEDGEQRWRGRAWWSMVGRKWVDGEREGKFGGKLGGNMNEKMGVLHWFWFQILKFLILIFF